jgi:predicted short-subunit dehydrogenase-like oxidoreductase (DUF2520 family)
MTHAVFVMGAGRAGLGLARALRASGVAVIGLHGRAGGSGSALSCAEDAVSTGVIPRESLARATTVLVTVRDAQMDEALRELAAAAPAPGTVILHASGSAEPATLADLRGRGFPCGTFHPLVPLADPARASAMLRGAWIGIDGDELALERAAALAVRLGSHVLNIPAGQKSRYHASAVVASNFPAVLLSIAERLLGATGVPGEVSGQALRPLFHAASENVRGRTPAEALTGPVVRGDVGTIRAHLRALADDPDALDVYRALTRAAIPLARARGVEGRTLEELAALLSAER